MDLLDLFHFWLKRRFIHQSIKNEEEYYYNLGIIRSKIFFYQSSIYSSIIFIFIPTKLICTIFSYKFPFLPFKYKLDSCSNKWFCNKFLVENFFDLFGQLFPVWKKFHTGFNKFGRSIDCWGRRWDIQIEIQFNINPITHYLTSPYIT